MTKPTDYEYSADSIVVLEGLEPVRKRPGMYVGDTGDAGLTRLILGLLERATDEVAAGQGKLLEVVLHEGGDCTVLDDTRPLPPKALPLALTRLHGGMHIHHAVSTDLPITSALSTEMTIDCWRAGEQWRQRTARGKLVGEVEQVRPPEAISPHAPQGNRVRFAPDWDIFEEDADFDTEQLATRLRDLAVHLPGLTARLIDERSDETSEFHYPEGPASFIAQQVTGEPLPGRPLTLRAEWRGTQVDYTLQWSSEEEDASVLAFANLLSLEEGDHEDGLLRALSLALTRHARRFGRPSALLTTADVRRGLVVVATARDSGDGPFHSSPTRYRRPGLADALPLLLEAQLQAAFKSEPAAFDLLLARLTEL